MSLSNTKEHLHSAFGWGRNVEKALAALPELGQRVRITLPGQTTLQVDPLPQKIQVRQGTSLNQPLPTSYLGFVGDFSGTAEDVVTEHYLRFLNNFFIEFKDTWPNIMLGFVANIEVEISQSALFLTVANPPNISTVAVQAQPLSSELPTNEGQWLANYIAGQNKNGQPNFHISEHRTDLDSLNPPNQKILERRQNNTLRLIAAMSGALFVCNLDGLNDHTLLAVKIARKIERPVFFLNQLLDPTMQAYLSRIGCHGVSEPSEMVAILKS